jgi:hypothetical protein
MQFLEFAQFYLPGLEADEVRFNVQIALITAAMNDFPAGLQYWTLGLPSAASRPSPPKVAESRRGSEGFEPLIESQLSQRAGSARTCSSFTSRL